MNVSTDPTVSIPPPATETPVPARHRVEPRDPATFSTHRVCALRHTFQDHPLMQLPALAQLARELTPTRQCRFIQPDSTAGSKFDHLPADPAGRDIDEVFRRIEESGSWVAFYNVETIPRYRAFLDEVVAAFRRLVEREQSGIFNVGGFIFISAPPSVTPFHIDRENNFWLQMRGRKSINVWDPTDRRAVPAPLVDRFVVHAVLDEVRLKDGDIERSHAFDVGAGDGVYFPSTSPHTTATVPGWTKPGDGVSVSIGVVFYTDQTRRAAYVHAANLFLRKLGLSPALPGASAFADALKHPLGRLIVWGNRTFRGYKPRVGF